MTRDEFQALMRDEFEKILEINNSKGHDYAGEQHALSNFTRNAERLGMTPLQVWSVYFYKHLDAIETYVREGGVRSEPIEGRIHDAILYLFLLRGLIEEQRVDGPKTIVTYPPGSSFTVDGREVPNAQVAEQIARGGHGS